MRAVAASILVLALAGCGKKEASKEEPAKTVASAAPSASASAAPKAVSVTVSGAYEAKRGEVRTPSDAPPFVHPEDETALGKGELTVTLPAEPGVVDGSAKGALGPQTFTGFLDAEGRLTGTLTPESGASPAMWGTVDAKVEGIGASRVVRGTIRASGFDGRVVREASFQLDPKG